MTLKYRPMAIMGFSSLSVLFLCTYFDDRFSFVSIGAGIVILLLTLAIGKLRERVTPFFIAARSFFREFPSRCSATIRFPMPTA